MANGGRARVVVVPVDKQRSAVEGFLTIDLPGCPPRCHWMRIDRLGAAAADGVAAPPDGGSRPAPPQLQQHQNQRSGRHHHHLKDATLECSPQLQELLQGCLPQLCAHLRSSATLDGFLSELSDVAERLERQRCAAAPPPPAFYQLLLDDIAALGWDRVVLHSQDCSSLSLLATDAAGRQHVLHVKLPPGYPSSPPVLTADLPAPLQLRWPPPHAADGGSNVGSSNSCSGSSSASARGLLPYVLRQFEAALTQHQQLWACLDDIDVHCVVLEPKLAPPPPLAAKQPQPARAAAAAATAAAVAAVGDPQAPGRFFSSSAPRSCVQRRLALGGHCSLSIELDPSSPRKLPELRFLGAPQLVGPLQERLFAGVAGWSEALLPRQNLERLLGVTLPTPASVDGAKGGGAAAAAADDVSADCSICYAYRLPDPGADAAADGKQQLGAAPDVYCSNAACSKPFHGRCLAEWLQSLRDTTSSFGSLFGRCPYCDTLVSVKLAV